MQLLYIIDATMKDILLEANGLLVDWANSSPKWNKTWKERRDTLNESWEEVGRKLEFNY